MEHLQQEFEANSFPQTYRWCVRWTMFWYYGQDQEEHNDCWLSYAAFGSSWPHTQQREVKIQTWMISLKNRSKLFGQMVDKSTQIQPKSRRPKRCQYPRMSETSTDFSAWWISWVNFSPNFAEKTKPLQELLRKDNVWLWGIPEWGAFEEVR